MVVVLLYYGITAFIAFRTSKSILKEFKTVNDSLFITNESFKKNGPDLSIACSDALQRNDLQPIFDQYQLSLQKMDSISDLIKSTKDTLLLISASVQDYDAPSNYMIEGENAEKLKFKINNYISSTNILRKRLAVSEKNTNYLISKEEDGIEISWEMYNFFHLPLAAMITSLSVIEADIQNMQVELKKDLEDYSRKLK